MATKTSLSQLYVSLLNACRGLPRDPLRPTLQLPDTLEHLVKRTFQIESAATAGTKSASRPSLPSETPESLPLSKSKDEFMTTAQRETLEASLRAIESIGRGKAMSKYPITRATLAPPTDPLYYTRLLQGVELSAQGKARSWWKRFFQIKGAA